MNVGKVCPVCGENFTTLMTGAKTEQRYCTRKCRGKVKNRKKHERRLRKKGTVVVKVMGERVFHNFAELQAEFRRLVNSNADSQ